MNRPKSLFKLVRKRYDKRIKTELSPKLDSNLGHGANDFIEKAKKSRDIFIEKNEKEALTYLKHEN